MAVSPSARFLYSYKEHKDEWLWRNSYGIDDGDGVFVRRFLLADRVTATAPTTNGERKNPTVLALAPLNAFNRSNRVDKRTKALRSVTDASPEAESIFTSAVPAPAAQTSTAGVKARWCKFDRVYEGEISMALEICQLMPSSTAPSALEITADMTLRK